ncbi:helix-turn-helix transcriptional regulator [Nonomuraea sp. MG754425]|uniref:helix-turn-helix transcriptional regulator n=1 Tax=Nonomuraea sp. MG754425 TaxID=2570319 RepID=UPI0027E19975|nr:helix-turn-helix transcriptional regulator [Nonomuraea sp. MG754425]
MTVIARPPFAGRLLPLAAGGAGAAAVAALLGLRLAGHGGFPTDPVGVLALATAATGAAVAATRLTAAGNRRSGTLAAWLCVALLTYLGVAAWAVWAVATGNPTAALAVAIWSSAWIPPLALMQLAASAAIRTGERAPWTHRVLAWAIIAVTLANSLLTTPSDPFTGLPTIAPESWRTALEPLGGLATLLGVLALLLIPISLWRAALGSAGAARARIGVAAAGTTGAPLTVCFCLLLAIARDPGAVEPSLGSAAFLVTLAGASAFSAACAVLAARGGVEPRHVEIVVRGTGLVAASLVVIGVGTLIASPGVRLGATALALSVAAVTLVVVGGAWAGTGRLARVLTSGERPVPDEEEVPAPPGAMPVPGLTPREAEVLAVLAEGASNAGIAAQLVVSERTVDAHLRAIFIKLDLKQEAGTNRRVQAARIWLDNAAANRRQGP